MAIVDSFGRRCDRMLRLHFRQVNHTHFDTFQAVSRAQRVFGKYGILVQTASVLALKLSNKDLSRFTVVTTECNGDEESAEQAELYDRFGVRDFTSVTVFLVQMLKDPVNPPLLPPNHDFEGCAAYRPGRPAVYLDAFTNGYTLAHELTHVLLDHAPVLLQEHSRDPANVLLDGLLETMTVKEPRVSIKQLESIRRSPHLVAC
jgi:hypothetical protein